MTRVIRNVVLTALLTAGALTLTVAADSGRAVAQPGTGETRSASDTQRIEELREQMRALRERGRAIRSHADTEGRREALRALREEQRNVMRELRTLGGGFIPTGPRAGTPAPPAPPLPRVEPSAPARGTPAVAAAEAAAPPTAAVPDTPRIAVLALRDVAPPAVAFLEAALGADPGWSLVDRASLDRVLSEQRLQLALTADDAGTRREVFKVAAADLILAVTGPGRVAVIHAETGLQTATLNAPADADPADAAAQLAARLREHLTDPNRRLRVVALTPAVDDRLVPAGDGLSVRLGDALRAALIERGAVLIDFGVAQELDRERMIRGDRGLTPIGRPWFVRSRISADPAAPDDVAIHVALQAGGLAVRAATWTAAFDADVPPFADSVSDAVASDGAAEIAVDLDELTGQIPVLRAAGQPRAALDVAETLLLYRPHDAELRASAMDLLRELVRRTLKDTDPDVSNAARMAAVAVRFESLCRHAEVVLARPAPPAVRGEEDGHRAIHLGGYNLPFVLRNLVSHRWGRRHTSHPSELPEPLKTQLGDPYHRLLRQHARRMLAVSESHLPPRFRSTIESVHDAWDDVLVDDELMDLRVALWERLLDAPPTDDSRPDLSRSLPARPQTVPQRRSLIAALDRARDAGGFAEYPLVFEAIRARLARESVARAEVFEPMVPNVAPARLGIGRPAGTPSTDDAAAANPTDAPSEAAELPTVTMRRLDVPGPTRSDRRMAYRFWEGLARCGEHGDLVYDDQEVALIRPDGNTVRQYRLPGEKPKPGLGVVEPAYDGRHLWVAVRGAKTRLLRINPGDGTAAPLALPQPLPPSDRGVAVAALDPGRLFVAGAFERDGGLRSWGLTVTAAAGGAATVETVFAVNSSFVSEDGKTVKAMPVGRARVIRSEGPEPATWVALEHGGLQLIDPATQTLFRPMRELWGGFDDLLFTDRQIVADSGRNHGTWALTAGVAMGKLVRRHFDMPRINRPFGADGWEMRIDGRPRHPVLYASPNPALALRPVVRLIRAERSEERLLGSFQVPTLVSPHQGLMLLLHHEIRAGRLPDDLHARFADAVVPEVSRSRRVDGQAFAVVTQPGKPEFTGLKFTFDQAVVAVDRLGHRLPESPAERNALAASQGRYSPGRWVGFSSDRRGELTPADLRPIPDGRYGVAQAPDGSLEGRERAGVAEVYAPLSDEAFQAIAAQRREDRVARRADRRAARAAPVADLVAAPGDTPTTPPVLKLGPAPDGTPRPPLGVPDTIRSGLSIALTELTRLQYLRVTDPDEAHDLSPGGTLIAAWTPQELRATEALAFCEALRKQTGENWRLPTEAEWEYAAGLPAADPGVARWTSDPGAPGSAGGSHRVAAHGPDRRGLYDLRGNLAEWTDSVYEPDSGHTRPLRTGDRRPVLIERGGAWFDDPSRCTAAARRPGLGRAGVRLVLEADASGG